MTLKNRRRSCQRHRRKKKIPEKSGDDRMMSAFWHWGTHSGIPYLVNAECLSKVVLHKFSAFPVPAVDNEHHKWIDADQINTLAALGLITISHGRVCLYLSSETTVDNLNTTNKSINVNNHTLELRPLLSKAKRVILSNVCPIIPHSVIEAKLLELNVTKKSQISFIKAGMNDPGYTHILSFRKQVYIEPEDINKLPNNEGVHDKGPQIAPQQVVPSSTPEVTPSENSEKIQNISPPNQEKIAFKIPSVGGIKRALSSTSSSIDGASEINITDNSAKIIKEITEIENSDSKKPEKKKTKKVDLSFDIREQLELAKSYILKICPSLQLRPTVDRCRALCIACNKTIRCCKTDVDNHEKTNVHHKAKRAEIKLSAFFAEHNVAFCTVDHLIPLIKDICIEPEVVQDLSLARHKCAKIVTNVIAKREIENIIDCLKTCRFSILIDESTDISDTKLMCVLVRYVSPLDGSIITQLLELLQSDATDCSAIREMLVGLPLQDPFFKQLHFLDPKIALYDEELAFEWRISPSSFDDDDKKELIGLTLDKMWKRILDVTNFDGEKMFPNLKSLVAIVLSSPHSNAEAERIFSIVTDVKNKIK
nr:PREDICTED: uncharacterized protein LOC105663392 [Megachile rotundata]